MPLTIWQISGKLAGQEAPIRIRARRSAASRLAVLRPARSAPVRATTTPAIGDALAGNHGWGPATADFLDSLRVLLTIAGDAGTLSGSGSGGSGDSPSAARAGFGPGEAPQDFERVCALVELAQRGDSEAFGLLYERYVDVVYRYVYVRVGGRQLAEDITSETFLRALRRMDSFSWQGRDIAAWFITIARNLITDNAKSARFRMEVSTADMLDADPRVEAAPDHEVLDRLRNARLLEAVKGLKPEQAECVVLRFLQGLSLAETAKVLGKSEGAVKQLQLRAVRALHRELADVDI